MGREGALSHPLLACGGLWGLQAGLALSGDWGGSWQGAGEGGQWALVFARDFSFQDASTLDKHDLIPPQGSNMKGRNKPGVGPTIPRHRLENQVRQGSGKTRGAEAPALATWSLPPGSLSSGRGPRKRPRSRSMVEVRQAVEGSQLGHSWLCA